MEMIWTDSLLILGVPVSNEVIYTELQSQEILSSRTAAEVNEAQMSPMPMVDYCSHIWNFAPKYCL